jgi:hypothetical protein
MLAPHLVGACFIHTDSMPHYCRRSEPDMGGLSSPNHGIWTPMAWLRALRQAGAPARLCAACVRCCFLSPFNVMATNRAVLPA